MILSADLTALLLSHRLKVLRLMYESFFNHVMQEQRNEMLDNNNNNVVGCLRKWAQINFSCFQFRSRSRDWRREGWKMCVIERDGKRELRCMNNARIQRTHTMRMCTYHVTAAVRLNGARPLQKNDWLILWSTIKQRHGIFIWWPTMVSSDAYSRQVIDEACYIRIRFKRPA